MPRPPCHSANNRTGNDCGDAGEHRVSPRASRSLRRPGRSVGRGGQVAPGAGSIRSEDECSDPRRLARASSCFTGPSTPGLGLPYSQPRSHLSRTEARRDRSRSMPQPRVTAAPTTPILRQTGRRRSSVESRIAMCQTPASTRRHRPHRVPTLARRLHSRHDFPVFQVSQS